MSLQQRVLILGAGGQLGQELGSVFTKAGEIFSFDRGMVDLASEEQIRTAVREIKPDVILNAAAYTAVDRAETEHELAFAINAHAPRVLAEEAARRNCLLVHYSTDYVFDGAKNSAWSELDPTGPLNSYGTSKLAGEEAVREVGGKYLIFRTSWVYNHLGNNFLRTMLRLGRERKSLRIVSDQIGAPTSTEALAVATYSIVEGIGAAETNATANSTDWAGLYHMTCAGSTSWCGFAEAIFSNAEELKLLKEPKPELIGIPASEYPTPAKRPQNSVLSNEKLLRQFGVRLPEWQDALVSTMRKMQEKSSRL